MVPRVKKFSPGRLYSVYARRHGDTRWVRLSSLVLGKPVAVKFFQGLLLCGSLNYGLEMALRVSYQDSAVSYPTLSEVADGKVS